MTTPEATNANEVIPEQYAVLILVRDNEAAEGPEQFHLKAWLPGNVQLATAANWDAPFASFGSSSLNVGAQVLRSSLEERRGDGISGSVAGAAADIAPDSLRFQKMSRSYWQSNSPISLTLPLEFRAVDNAKADVHEVWWRLHALNLPRKGGGNSLVPPGPTGRRYISVAVGRFLRMHNVIVKTVNSDMRMIQDSQGVPVKMVVSVTFETDRIVTYEDWQQMSNFSKNNPYSQVAERLGQLEPDGEQEQ